MALNKHKPSKIEKKWRTLHDALINSKPTPEITIDINVLLKWSKIINKHRAELISLRFSTLSLEMFYDLITGFMEITLQAKAIFGSKKPKKYGKELTEAMYLTIQMGYLFIVYGRKRDVVEVCLYYMTIFDRGHVFSDTSKSYDYEWVNFHRMMYTEIKAGRMPYEFIDAYLGLRFTDPIRDYENLHYYYDMMKRIISENNIAQRDMFLIWGSMKCYNPEDFVKLAKRPVSFPPLFKMTDLEWKIKFAFALHATSDYEASKKLASELLKENKDKTEKEIQFYKPLLLYILGKHKNAISEAEKSLKSGYKNGELKTFLFYGYCYQGEISKALKIFNESSKSFFHLEPAVYLFFIYLNLGKITQAERIFNQVSAKSNSIILTNLMRAFIHFHTNNISKARNFFKKVLKSNLDLQIQGVYRFNKPDMDNNLALFNT